MSLSVYLESQKQAIANTVALQNALKQQNPNSASKADFSDMRISIFSDQIKNEIRNKSAICNDNSIKVATAKGKNQSEVAKSVSKVNAGITDLQSLISWAGAASGQLAGLSGISDSAVNAISSNMGSAINFGASEIANSVSQANQALSQISVPENQPLQTAIKSVQSNMNTAVNNTVSTQETTKAVVDTTVNKVASNTETTKAFEGKDAEKTPAKEMSKEDLEKYKTLTEKTTGKELSEKDLQDYKTLREKETTPLENLTKNVTSPFEKAIEATGKGNIATPAEQTTNIFGTDNVTTPVTTAKTVTKTPTDTVIQENPFVPPATS